MTAFTRLHVTSEDIQHLQSDICEIFHWAAAKAEAAAASDNPAATLEWAEFAAKLAWRADPGFFFDRGIETTLSVVPLAPGGQKWGAPEIAQLPRRGAGKRIMHVLTTAYETGGHTRAVARWIENCKVWRPEERHVVVIASQSSEPVPQWLETASALAGGKLIVFDHRYSLFQRAIALRQLADSWADDVVLHLHPDDSASVSALAQPRRWKAYFFNHADHVFSLGTQHCDILLDLRWSGADSSWAERSSRPVKRLLPIPLAAPAAGDRRRLRAEARRALGINDRSIVAITMGRAEKYKTAMGWDFCMAAEEILQSQPSLELFAIGLPNQGRWNKLQINTNGRFHPLGPMRDPEVLRNCYSAANLYFEGFPFASTTAMLDAGLYGLPLQRFSNRIAPLLSGDDVSLEDICPASATQEGYISSATALASHGFAQLDELGLEIKRRIENDHCGQGWTANWLANIESLAPNVVPHECSPTHAPADRAAQHSAILQWQAENFGLEPAFNVLKSSHHLGFTRKCGITWKLLSRPSPIINSRIETNHLTTVAKAATLAFTPPIVARVLSNCRDLLRASRRFLFKNSM